MLIFSPEGIHKNKKKCTGVHFFLKVISIYFKLLFLINILDFAPSLDWKVSD